MGTEENPGTSLAVCLLLAFQQGFLFSYIQSREFWVGINKETERVTFLSAQSMCVGFISQMTADDLEMSLAPLQLLSEAQEL